MTAEEQRRLTSYATVGRYPGSGAISLAEARRAVAMRVGFAREIRWVLLHEILRRRKTRWILATELSHLARKDAEGVPLAPAILVLFREP
jgi:hypothetical protein